MAFRGQKATCAVLLILAVSPTARPEPPELRYRVVHVRNFWRDASGEVVITPEYVAYQEQQRTGKKRPGRSQRILWRYEDIQQLRLAPRELVITTYKDRKWLLGLDEQWRFKLLGSQSFEEAYRWLKTRLDERFVAALGDSEFQPLWKMPVKLLGGIQGSLGTLEVGGDRVVFRAEAGNASRTWRLRDIANVSSAGRFQLTITTYERSKWHYGGMRDFNFQTRQPLNPARVDELWRRLHQAQGLPLLGWIEAPEKPDPPRQ